MWKDIPRQDEYKHMEEIKCMCVGAAAYLTGSVQVFLLLGEFVEGEEGVAVASRAVTDSITLPQ